MQRVVLGGRACKEARVVRRIGVDEKAAAKGHTYLTLVCDLAEGTVEPIAEDRTQESLDGYYAGLTQPQLDGIEAVAMDRGEPSLQATRAWVRDATKKIVFDRFHIRGHVGQAVDTVRKQEHRTLMASGDERLKGNVLVALQPGECTGTPASRVRRTDVPGAQVGQAWAIKEALRRLWHYVYPASGWKFWKRWYFWATYSGLEPTRKAAETIRRHIDNILTYDQHPVTNAMSEGLNSQIQNIKSMDCGFRHTEPFKTAIYVRCGGLDLYSC